jgi:epsilon-lactone hydrolase
MASKQPLAVRELYAGWTRTRLNGEEQDNEHWGDLTRDPGGVDYIETGAGGVPAMWVIPKEAAGDRVLLCIHCASTAGGSSVARSTPTVSCSATWPSRPGPAR